MIRWNRLVCCAVLILSGGAPACHTAPGSASAIASTPERSTWLDLPPNVRVIRGTEGRRIDALLRAFFERGQFNGAIGVARRGAPVYVAGFGVANPEWTTPNSPDTRFHIASINKTFTAMLILRLIDQGRLRLDSTLGELLPDVPFMDAASITVRHLLTHTSGMPRDISDFPPGSSNFPDRVAKINADFYTLEEQVRIIAERPLQSEPGRRYDYSSDGYAVLGLIVERVTGRPYEDALRRAILDPLGMEASGYASQLVIVPNRASGIIEKFDGIEHARRFAVSPAGGMFSTVEDLLKLDAALFDHAVLSAASKKAAWSPSPFITAYGWKVRPDTGARTDGALRVQASGSLPGFKALFTRTLDDGLCVAVLLNTSGPRTPSMDAVTEGVLAILRGREPEPPRRSAAFDLIEIIRRDGIDQAVAAFSEWKHRGFVTHAPVESEINSLGYFLLARGHTREAVEVLRLNAIEFPASANVHDSLGEALLVMGRRDEAVASYRRVLEIDPAHENAAAVLRDLQDRGR